MTHAVLIKPSARRELEALPDQVLRRVDHVIVSLSVGDYRVVYRVDDPLRAVEITRIGHPSFLSSIRNCG